MRAKVDHFKLRLIMIFAFANIIGVNHGLAQAIVLDTFYNDSFCIAAPLSFPSDTINLDSERVACVEAIKEAALENAHRAWKDSIARLIADHINKQKCMSSPFAETFTVTHQTTEHHYTLYYYNQAGNLVQTISPAGVHPLGMESFPEGNWNGDPPPHDTLFISRYEYNSAGQVLNQTTIDAGESSYAYDRAQRLRFSQNAEQQPDNDFAYTKYDGQGRIIEVGELDNYVPSSSEIADQSFPDGGIVTIEDAISTTYDYVDPVGLIPSENTRGRVAEMQNPHMSSFFDYDAHGNVREYTQIIPDLHDDTVSMKYSYDLISGNVNEFRYEPTELDQFTQRYLYDADNRIQAAYSSDNGYLFEEDARYFYYLHGHLARVELGEDKVQGMDYFYTLQGWIKGVNMAGAENPGMDPGFDGYVSGHSNLNRYFGIDTMKYLLGYNFSDYTPIGGSGLLSNAINVSWNWMGNSILPIGSGYGLYNGNISMMLTDNSKGVLGMAYQYDALHRIKNAENYDWSGSNWSGAAGKYQSTFTYDANGNLKTIYQKGLATSDNLTYDYYDDGGDPYLKPNRLEKVTGTSTLSEIGTQSALNYDYDEIGNLTDDDVEGTGMSWDVFGKLRTVDGAPEGAIGYNYDVMGNRLIKSRGGEFPGDVYVRDASGNIIAIYEEELGEIVLERLKEVDLYGSSRLGVINPERIVYHSMDGEDTLRYASFRALKSYELSNHLGNVLTTISDRKVGIDENLDNLADIYHASRLTASDYYPFGLEMPGRTISPDNHRFGFNGKEKDPSISSLTHYDYGFRIYNPAIGRFLSVDPLTRSYPMLTPYQFASNSPIFAIDLDGLEIASPFVLFRERLGKTTEKILTFSDVNDFNVLGSWISPNENATNVDETPATISDKSFAIIGGIVPFASGSAIKNVLKVSKIAFYEFKYGSKIAEVIVNAEGGILRKNLLNAGVNLADREAHHIIPVQLLKENNVVKDAVNAGFDFNGISNGIGLTKVAEGGVHANHPNYTKQIQKSLNNFVLQNKNYTPEQAKLFLEGYVNNLRSQIIKESVEGGKKINTLELMRN